jgi:hypothetical protein
MRSVRTVVRTLIAGFFVLVGPVLAAPAVAAHAQEAHEQSYGTVSASSRQLTISIDGMSPNFATSGSTVTVHGTVTNHTGSPLRDIQVQLLTEAQFFYIRADMDSWAAGNTPGYLYPQPVGSPVVVKGTLHSGATAHWTASFTAADANYYAFGVYPLAAQAEFPDGTASGSVHTFLPYWPGKGAAKPLSTAWIWPLIDQPQQGPCPQTLATNSLAASLSDSGRLGRLLAVGQPWSANDRLTWAVDPALLSDADVMTRQYTVDANSRCVHGASQPASKTATTWLSTLRSETSADSMFVTPYADADVSALAHAGLAVDLRAAYRLGESVAASILSRRGSAAVAWPADGAADAGVLSSLAVNSGVATAVLSSSELRPADPRYDDAVTSVRTGKGTSMGVLRADSELTGILGSATAGSPASAQFTAEQDFLAQTAMIVAEGPQLRRSLVIAPPRRWDPSATEAAKLLAMTFKAPWLRKVPLSTLAASASTVKRHQKLPDYQARPAELGQTYLEQVSSTDANLAVYENLLLKPSPSLVNRLDGAAIATESVAWRGAGTAAGRLAVGKLADYLIDAEKNVQIITGTKLLLAGASGPAPVSVRNAGQLPVVVKIVVTLPSNSQLSIGNLNDPITIPAGETRTVKMTVHSTAIGTTQMQLQLVTKDGSPLGTSHSLSVQTTRYGRALLVLIGAALGVLVLTSVGRWIRRLNDGRAHGRSGGAG